MTKVHQALLLGSSALLGLSSALPARAQPAAFGPHPRIWLDAATHRAIQAQANVPNGPVARAQRRCAAAQQNPAEYSEGGWQGFEFVLTLSACLTSYVATGDGGASSTSIKYWQVLLDDYRNVGDGLGGDGVVAHDDGYAMRTFAPFSALAYDWLHDAPGVTEELRAHARARFDAWSTYYATRGYLRDRPGANYHAGYAFAATLMAIAEAGEAGAAGETHLRNVRDVIWQQGLLPALGPGNVLDGGDWPEGWQYGALSVLELSLAARALNENGLGGGAPVAAWASSLPLRFLHGLTPRTRLTFAGGDSDAPFAHRAPDNGALLATLAGPASAEAKALARKLNTELGLHHENPLFDALGAADVAPAASAPAQAPTSYLARGTGNWYVRGSWASETTWGVFQCSRQLVEDHQYANAGNWVLSRGADDVVIDPSPYGSLSTLTGNAPAVDSRAVPEGYSPSQGYWGEKTALVFARQSGSGVAAARCDYADQFRRRDVPSDVSLALRDFVLVPDGDGGSVLLIDRVATGAAERGLHFRVRTPASLTLANDTATGQVGSSRLVIQKLWSSPGAVAVRGVNQARECPSSNHVCDLSKLPSTQEYRADFSGPNAFAIHAISARTGGEAAAEALSGPGFRGALLAQRERKVAVVVADALSLAPSAALTYRAAASALVHVVLDAPRDAQGRSDVRTSRDGADCVVQVTPHAGATPGFDALPLIVRLDTACAVEDDGPAPSLGLGELAGSGSGPVSASSAIPEAEAVGTGGALPPEAGEGCSVASRGGARNRRQGWALAVTLVASPLLRRRRRASRSR